MSDTANNIVLEHLKHIRGRVDQIAGDMKDVKARLLSLESHDAAGHLDSLRHSTRLEELDERLQKVEKRLELI
ncbi:MAG: hypothetical protein SFV19_12735 [Rhodospirillaceae bacterium]|nr:hypothetical protein [Rhodospirillaceae bacterium]